MSWPTAWPTATAAANPAAAAMQSALLSTPVNSAPPVVAPAMQYNVATAATAASAAEQWQNWQQWAQWQQQYQQWHQQYGAEYQKSLSAMQAAAMTQPPLPTAMPTMAAAMQPPLPTDTRPPLPPEEPPKMVAPVMGNYTTAPPAYMGQHLQDPYGQQRMGVVQQQQAQKRPHEQQRDMGGDAAKRQYLGTGAAPQQQQWAGVTTAAVRPQAPAVQTGAAGATTAAAAAPAAKNSVEELSEAEKKFDKEFAAWEAQFNKWKEQNVNHPDKAQYREYEKKWESWRNSLLERREQMRRKRLALAATPTAGATPSPSKPTQPAAASTPTATGVRSGQQQQPPLLGQQPNFAQQPLFGQPPPPTFSKPPPNQNDEPLSFKPKPGEDATGGGDFLKSTSDKPGGIPGLDLVKDSDDSEPTKEADEVVDLDRDEAGNETNVPAPKGPDFAAISKGINTILGDQKLLNMLSQVSQNQAPTVPDQPVLTDSIAGGFSGGKPDYSAPPPSFQNFRGVGQQPPADYTKPPPQFGDGPTAGGQRSFPSNDYANQGYDDRYKQDEYYGQAAGDISNNFDDQTRSSFHDDPGFKGGQRTSRFPPENDRIQGGVAGRPPPLMGQRIGPPPGADRFGGGRPALLPDPKLGGGPDADRFGGGKGLLPEPDRGRMGPSPDLEKFGGGRGGPHRDMDRFGGPGGDRFGAGRFGGGREDDRFPADRFGGPAGRGGPLGNDRFQGGRPGFGGRPGGFGRNNSFGRKDDYGDNYEDDNEEEDFEKYHQMFSDDQHDEPPPPFQRPGRFEKGGRMGAPMGVRMGDRMEGSVCDRMGGLLGDRMGGPMSDRMGPGGRGGKPIPPLMRAPMELPPPVHEPSPPPVQPEEEEPTLLEFEIIEYDHKSKILPERDVTVEPFFMFDYRHKPLNRVPIPQRPEWLAEAVRFIREFDPLAPRNTGIYDRPPINNRYSRADDRFEGRLDRRFENDRRNIEPHDAVASRRDRGRRDSRDRSYIMDRGRRSSRDREAPAERRRSNDRGRFNRREPNRRSEDRPILRKEDLEELSDGDDFGDAAPDQPSRRDDRRKNNGNDRDGDGAGKRKRSASPEMSNPPNPTPVQSDVTMIDDLLSPPGRFKRPPRIVIILRGPPGSGKTYLAKLIKDKEVEQGGSAPRILSLDDYFMVEHETEVTEDGKTQKVKEMVYEYEAEMEESYRNSLMKSFKKTVTDGFFPFIIVDNINDKVKHFGEMWSFAKQNGFQVYVCQLDLDPVACTKRNVHGRSQTEIEDCIAGWEPTPSHHPSLDASNLLQSGAAIAEVEMEVVEEGRSDDDGGDAKDQEDRKKKNEDEDVKEVVRDHLRSKWDNFDCSNNNLARLDGVNKPLKKSGTMEEYLQMEGEWQPPESTVPGKKRVRWADLEAQRQQAKMRALGFVVGHTDWDRMMDPTNGGSALTQTKYIRKINRF